MLNNEKLNVSNTKIEFEYLILSLRYPIRGDPRKNIGNNNLLPQGCHLIVNEKSSIEITIEINNGVSPVLFTPRFQG